VLFRPNPVLTLGQKVLGLHWGLLGLLAALAAIGSTMLYSAAGGSLDPWASRHAIRFAMTAALMIGVALVDVRVWFRWAYWIYAIALLLLLAVDVMGTIGMGAQRWISLGVIQIQPSEVMKVAVILALARFFHGQTLAEIGRPLTLVVPLVLVLLPVALVMKQPDLGTACVILMVSGMIFLLAGVRLWKFLLVAVVVGACVPLGWSMLHDYQQQRVLTFLDPARDPLGAGYHITQSKIALGSGGIFGKGFLQGSQSHLNFLPEKQTDFIFTMLGEEFGMIGGLAVLTIFLLIFVYGYVIAFRSRSHFGRLLAAGLTCNLFLYVFINVAMVMGLIPVVGVPLPLISYGGTAMLTILVSSGLLMGVSIHREVHIPRRGAGDDG